ncbi:MAG: OsmC family protein [Candidatus Calescibacterium sp.]|nr:OsmC family protein [Candidatus Calescibacterium sp.]MDW8132271.1 OsmC family protein [Candidatus Calescibacterium sp.]
MKNVDLKRLKDFITDSVSNPELLKKDVSVEVRWNMNDNESQMYSVVVYPLGEKELNIDQVDFLGGGGRSPNPIQYCLVGLASCFLSTFAIVCKELNLNVKSLSVVARNRMNLSLPLGLDNEKVSEGVEFEIIVDSEDEKEMFEQAKNIAIGRCPAVWCMQNSVPVNARIHFS